MQSSSSPPPPSHLSSRSVMLSPLPPSHHPSLSPSPSSLPLRASLSNPSLNSLINKPTFLEHGNYRFVILDTPTNSNIASYVEYLKKKRVVAVARACEATYSANAFTDNGIKVIEVPFADGESPPDAVVDKFLTLVNEVFGPPILSSHSTSNTHKHSHTQRSGSGHAAHTANGNGNTRGASPSPVPEEASPTGATAAAHAGGSSSSVNASAPAAVSPKPSIAVHCVAGLGRAPVLVCIALIQSGMSAYDAVQFVRKKRRGAINSKQLEFLERYTPRRMSGAGVACCVIS